MSELIINEVGESMKDWPPQASFKTVFPQLYKDFMQALPLKAFTHADGSLNLASNFPENAISPDLGEFGVYLWAAHAKTYVGPKMYIAREDRNKQGSTRLHMDLSDAINILVRTENSSTGDQGGALWHIFSREDTARLSEILKSHPSYPREGNPIHQQTIYLTSLELARLEELHGIIPYSIIQRAGQAVCIPAGCAHQVCNVFDAPLSVLILNLGE